jgi:antagonist of KipI
MDEYALAAANLLCGNGRDAAALEITLYGGAFEFMRRTVAAVCGADLSPSLNGRPLSMWRAVPVNRGDLLRFGSARAGCRAYLAIAGGFAAPRSLGSRATFVRARLGGLEGRALQKGDVLFAYSAVRPKTGGGLPAALIPRYPAHLEVRVVLGPQQDAFTQAGTNAFLGGEYLVTPASDRMGYRLSGPRIGHVRGADIVTDPVPPGAVQVPGDGQPILLAADRQTTGGYAKIAVVLAADLDAVGQLRPGDRIRFRAVDLGEANRALHARQNRFQALQTAVR